MIESDNRDITERSVAFYKQFRKWLKEMDIADVQVVIVGLGIFLSEMIALSAPVGKETAVFNEFIRALNNDFNNNKNRGHKGEGQGVPV